MTGSDRRRAVPHGGVRAASMPLRLGRFTLERFPLPAYLPLVAAFALGGRAGAAAAARSGPIVDWRLAAVALAVAAAFLQLRALDEVRDEAVDRLGRPSRPLPRGLVTRRELRLYAAAAAAVGVGIAMTTGTTSAVLYGLALGAIWMAGHGRLFRAWARRGIVANALAHSLISPLLMAFAWFSATHSTSAGALGGVLLIAWGASLGFEVARKTRRPAEERPFVETYSGALSRARAIRLAAASLMVACVGALLVTVAVDGPAPAIATPMLAGGLAALLARVGGHLGTRALQSVVAGAVLGLMLWPVVLASLRVAAPVTVAAGSP